MRRRLASIARLFLMPRTFFLGFAAGMTACALLGRQVERDGFYQNFVRVGGPFQIDNTFLISPRQMTLWIRAHCSRDKTLVLVGGSSIMMGTGQPVRELWSRKLQDLLGDRFCVVNLAGPAGALNGFASTTLGILEKEYKGAYLVSDMTDTVAAYSPDGVVSQKHYFWSAYYNGMLDPSFVADGTDPSGRLRVQKSSMTDSERARAEQLRLGAWLDSFLHFNDLWASLHFNHFTTYYFHNAGAWQWTARRTWPDYDYEVDFDSLRRLKQYTEAVGSPGFEGTLGRLRKLDTYFQSVRGGFRLRERMLGVFEQQLRDNIVDARKHRVILAYIGPTPYYMDHLTEAERGAYETLYERKSAIVRSHGYHVVRPLLSAEDFSDLVHLDALGGHKLAAAVAGEILAEEAAR